jgi:hypothetical protein
MGKWEESAVAKRSTLIGLEIAFYSLQIDVNSKDLIGKGTALRSILYIGHTAFPLSSTSLPTTPYLLSIP